MGQTRGWTEFESAYILSNLHRFDICIKILGDPKNGGFILHHTWFARTVPWKTEDLLFLRSKLVGSVPVIACDTLHSQRHRSALAPHWHAVLCGKQYGLEYNYESKPYYYIARTINRQT
jgi:hypothetical protein